MTTYGTFDIDSIPAPSDFELEAADRANSKGLVSFDHYCHQYNINYDRPEFWAYVREECGISGNMTWAGWDKLWTAFITREDARDLAETQRCALR